MKKVRIAMLLYIAVGLVPLAVFSSFIWPRIEKDYESERNEVISQATQAFERDTYRSRDVVNEFLRSEFSREFTEFQHWRAPLNVQSQAPSVVRSPLAGPPSDALVKYYFQFKSNGGPIVFSTPHQPDEDQQLEAYQSAAPLPGEFEVCLREAKESLTAALPAMLTAPLEGEPDVPPTGDLKTMFLQAKSGEKPASMQIVANEVIIVNSNSQEVANQARNAQVEKKQNKRGKENDPWSDLKKPPGIDDQYGDSLVQIFPYRAYVRPGDKPRLILWRTVRTPAEQILQGFEINTEFVRTGWAQSVYAGPHQRGSLFEAGASRPFSIAIESKSGAGSDLARATTVMGLFGAPAMPKLELGTLDDRLADTRRTFLLLGLGYVALLSVLGFALHRTVSSREALAQQQGEFVAAVSHELRTPLTAMRLFTELLLGQARAGKSEKTVEHASRILAEEERLTRLVEMILLAAKIERGSFKVEIAEAPLGDALNAAVETAQRAHAGREIIVEASDLPAVKQDRAAAQQVFFNLIDNALKYSRESNKPVRITRDAKEGRLVIRIHDEGIGIGEDDKKRLFERFARGTKASEQGAGTGLGLWLTREYARQMGWEVTLESKPGEGTAAVVSIRL